MSDSLAPAIWPQSPLPWERAPAATVIVWTFPSLNQVTADTHEQAMMLSLATYVKLRWPVAEEWPDTLTNAPTHWEDAVWILLAPWALLAFLAFFLL